MSLLETSYDYKKSVSRKKRIRKEATDAIKQTARLNYVFDLLDTEQFDDLPIRLDIMWNPVYFGYPDYYLGESQRSWGKPRVPVIALDYTGTAKSQQEAVVDLGNIQLAFKTLFQDPQPTFKTSRFKRTPKTVYKGVGEINEQTVCLQLECPWPPPGCEIEKVSVTEEKFQVSCANGE